MNEALVEGIKTIQIDTWLQVKCAHINTFTFEVQMWLKGKEVKKIMINKVTMFGYCEMGNTGVSLNLA